MKSLRAKMTILIALLVLISSGLLLVFNYRRALELEKASADGNEDIIMQQHEDVMTLYKETVKSITGTVL